MDRFLHPQTAAWWLLAASVAVLAGAFVLEYGVGVKPCVLCLLQRWPYVAAAGVLALGLALRRPGWLPVFFGLAAAAFLVGASIAVFHVGVEQQWWAGTPSCGVPDALPAGPVTLEDLKAQIFAQPVVRCDVVAWSLFGISLAGYNIGLSALLFAAAIAAAVHGFRRQRP